MPMSRKMQQASGQNIIPWYLMGGAPSPVAAYHPKGAASLAASYVNLANPGTFDAGLGVAPTWAAATGWGFNGTTQYLVTGVLPSNNWSMLVRFSDGVTTGANRSVCGSDNFVLRSNQTSAKFFGNGTFTFISPASAAGVMAVTDRAYFNGVVGGAVLTGAGATLNQVLLGAQNLSGSPVNFFVGNIQAVAIYSTILTAPQVAAVSTAMAAL